MNQWIRRAGVIAVSLCCSVAWAQGVSKASVSKNAPVPGSPEAQVAARFAEKSGGQKADQVFKGRGGLYEVLIGGQIYYVDSDVSFVLAGRMFDPATREDLTQKRLDTALKVDFKSLPLDRAIKTVRGDGSRVLVTFEDPNCGYCKRLWQGMGDLKNVTIYTFLFPILSPDSMDKSKAIWCSKDRSASWEDHMVQNKMAAPASGECKTPLDQNVALGHELGINGTPTIIFADGTRAAGALPVPMIEQRLAALKK
ncbi:MAG: DsbC family protein [Burkholderiaceae bacterium]